MIKLDFGQNLLIGIISGIVASIFFTLILFFIKPKITVSDKICCCIDSNNNKTYRIKIVNRTCFMLTNIKYKLFYCKIHGDGITTIQEIEPRKSPIICIDKYNFFDKEAKYAIRISYDIDFEKYPINENSKIEFVFIADHSLSNTTTCVKKEYVADDIIEGLFESKKSTNIIRKV